MASNSTASTYRGRVAGGAGDRSARSGHDREAEAEAVSGGLAAAVEHVLLQQREERLHRGVTTGSTDSAHGADESVPVKFGLEAP